MNEVSTHTPQEQFNFISLQDEGLEIRQHITR